MANAAVSAMQAKVRQLQSYLQREKLEILYAEQRQHVLPLEGASTRWTAFQILFPNDIESFDLVGSAFFTAWDGITGLPIAGGAATVSDLAMLVEQHERSIVEYIGRDSNLRR